MSFFSSFAYPKMGRRPARFTQADLARCIRAAQQCGASQVVVLPDGTIRIDLQSSNDTPTDDEASQRRRFGERLGKPAEPAAAWKDLEERGGSNPLATDLQQLMKGEITLDQLPPGRYPNGVRVYAEAEWEAIVRD